MLDNLDKNILKQLEINSRQSSSKIARQLNISKTVVTYRINRLQKRGIITGFQYLSNQAALGSLSFGLLLKFRGLLLEEEEALIRKIKADKTFNWLAPASGRWDAMAVAIHSDLGSFIHPLNEFLAKYGNHLKEYNFYIDYQGVISGHNYLYSEAFVKPVSYSDVTTRVVLNGLEKQVYRQLQLHPLGSLLRIATRLDKTYDTVKAKYRSLVANGVLLKPVPIIDHESIGYKSTILLYNLAPNTDKTELLLQFCADHPNIVRYARCLGHINLLLNIHSKGDKQLKQILGSINKDYSDIIVSYDLIHLVES